VIDFVPIPATFSELAAFGIVEEGVKPPNGALDVSVHEEQKHQRYREQNSSPGRELHHHRPEQAADNPPESGPPRFTSRSGPMDLVAVQFLAGAKLGVELRPDLLNRNSFRDALPERFEAARHKSGYTEGYLKDGPSSR
jgi:hypothetical protein